MLGKLVRWIRIMGHDVEYTTELDDKELLYIAKREQRILLTRDLELYKEATSKGIEAFYVSGETAQEELAQLSRRYSVPLRVNMSSSRCPKCNTQVSPALKEKIKDQVQANTYAHYNEFWQCPKCHQVYWQGAHWTRICNTLISAKKTFKNLK
jgi:uncharacterized protein with PIN domain